MLVTGLVVWIGFNSWLRGNGRVSSVIINVITEIIYRCNYMQVVFQYMYTSTMCVCMQSND